VREGVWRRMVGRESGPARVMAAAAAAAAPGGGARVAATALARRSAAAATAREQGWRSAASLPRTRRDSTDPRCKHFVGMRVGGRTWVQIWEPVGLPVGLELWVHKIKLGRGADDQPGRDLVGLEKAYEVWVDARPVRRRDCGVAPDSALGPNPAVPGLENARPRRRPRRGRASRHGG